MDVAQWLNGVGLGQYETLFREHAIDADVLIDLTEADLEKIGVPLGHRKRLMRAIAALAPPILPRAAGEDDHAQHGGGGELARRLSLTPSTAPQGVRKDARLPTGYGAVPLPRFPGEERADYAERRPITVMFCDLVGSTGLAAKLDAEDWRNLVGAYLDEASGAVTSLGGHVLKKLGDGLMALFGYPQAQENDAERAVRAALAIQRALADLNAANARSGAPELAARIGLECGSVIVDASGEVFGEAPNVAARVQAAAEPGTVLVTASVQRQTAGLFVAEDKGAHELKGVRAPMTLYRIVRASGAGRRGGARALTPLVGREDELALLTRRWSRALEGEGQFVQIVGEPGIGKSRLVEEFRAKLVETPHTWVEWAASQLLQNTPLHPLAEWGRLRYGGAGASGGQKLADLENTLRLVGLDAAEYAPLLAPLFDVPLPEDRAAKFAAEELRRRQLAAMTALFLAGARSQPIVLAFEDLHWADPTSLDLLRALGERGAQAPVLIVATTRPEFRPDWSLRSHHSVISLAPLDRAQVRKMVGEIASRHALSDAVIDGVGERTGGVPLFVEEVTRLLLERDAQGGAQAIPPTLQQSLAARLDRLGEAREVAQIGAVLGREFSYRLLQAVAGVAGAAVDDRGPGLSFPSSAGEGGAERQMGYGPLPRTRVGMHKRQPETESRETCPPHPIRPFGPPSPLRGEGGGAAVGDPAPQSALDRLVDADLLFVEGAGAQATYRFKHALIQDAAYDSLLRSRRQALHRRAAEALRNANAEPEAIAHHFTEAGLDDAAIEWWGKAGDQALRRSAFQEAIAHLGKAIAMADRAGETARQATGGSAAPSGRLTQLKVAYGNALFTARGPGARETTEAFSRARKSASGDKDAPERLAADFGLWVGSYLRGELPSMRAHAAAFLSDVEARPESLEAGVAHRTAGITCWFAGEYREARDHLERTLALFQPGRDEDLAYRFGLEPGVSAMFYLAITSWSLGDVERAISLVDSAQERIASVTHIGTHAHGKAHAAMFELMRGDHARATPNALELVRLAREYDMNPWRDYGVFLEGWATAASGAVGGGLEDMRRGVEQLREQNVLIFDGLLKIALAEAEARAGDPDRAVAILDEALATAERTGHRAFEAELHRVRGEILLERDPANPTPAEEAFLTAIAVAKQQATRSFELRAALSLAKLYQSTARLAEAHAILAPALEGFAPTPEMPEIAEAEALVAALSQTDEVKAQAVQRQRLTQLHVAQANALFAARGPGAPETTEAFARARESASGDKEAPERLAADWGLWVGSYARGELPSMRAHAAALVRDVEARPDSPEAGVAHRAAGRTCWFAGEYREARDHLERALALFRPGRDDDLAFRFGPDPGTAAMASLAMASWSLGEVDRGVSLIDRMQTRMADLAHVGTLALGRMHAALFELMRGDHALAAPNAVELVRLAGEQELPMFRAFGVFLEGWATAASGAPADGLGDMRRGAELLRKQNVLIFDGLLKIALAEAEARAGYPDRAVAILDEALATCDRTGHRAFEAELHRAHGDILLKRDPANPTPAEEALQTAIAVAKRQATRSFELRAALSLAKLYQSTDRPAEAHAVLASALDGFSPTPEMPEIAEAQALLAALAETVEVKVKAAQRVRRVELQTAFGQALMYSKGFAAGETQAAFARAGELAAQTGNRAERYAVYHAQWIGSFVRGEMDSARETAESFLREADAEGLATSVGVACRALGLSCLVQGDLSLSRRYLERALAEYVSERDVEARRLFGTDTRILATAYLSLSMWLLGDVESARRLSEQALREGEDSRQATTIANACYYSTLLEAVRDDPAATLRAAERLLAIATEHDMAFFVAMGQMHSRWARGRLGDTEAGASELRRALAGFLEQGDKYAAPLFHALAADLEAMSGNAERALESVALGLALADETGERWTDPLLYRRKGELLLKRDPTDPAPAEDALKTAVAIAQKQGSRSLGLRVALSLANLYQSTGRPAAAHAVLAPALEGFPFGRRAGDEGLSAREEGPATLTPDPSLVLRQAQHEGERGSPHFELPEIAEAQALLAALERKAPSPPAL